MLTCNGTVRFLDSSGATGAACALINFLCRVVECALATAGYPAGAHTSGGAQFTLRVCMRVVALCIVRNDQAGMPPSSGKRLRF